MKKAKRFLLLSILLIAAAMLWLPSETRAATFTVNSTSDAVDAAPGDGACQTATAGECTLRAAIMEANALAGPHTINVPAGTYTLTLAGADENAAATGDLDINESMTITGAGANSTTINGGGLDRIFDVDSRYIGGYSVVIQNLTITRGNAGDFDGGGVKNTGCASLALSSVTITGNTANWGGGVSNSQECSDMMTITNSTISGNTAINIGGGIYNNDPLTITNSTISGNSAGGGGGGIYNDDSTTSLTSLLNVTVANNSALGAGAGVYVIGFAAVATLNNTIVANNGTENCATGVQQQLGGTINSLGYNLDSANTCGFATVGDLINTNPNLGPLTNNGGQTQTHALLTSSPAINTANSATCPATDQRGYSRSGNCDIGAYEYSAAAPVVADLSITKTDSPDPVTAGSNLTYTITITNNGPAPATSVTLTDTLPGGVTFVSSTPSQGSCSGATVVTCTIGSLANSASATVVIVVTPASAGSLSNTASVTAAETDTNTANNSAAQDTTVSATGGGAPPTSGGDANSGESGGGGCGSGNSGGSNCSGDNSSSVCSQISGKRKNNQQPFSGAMMLILPVTWLLFRKTIKKKFKVQLITLAVFILISGAAYANEAAYEQRIARGVAELEDKNYTNAIESFNSALKEKPDDYRANLYLGIALSRTKDKDAEAMLKKAYSISPKEPRINLELGVYYFDNNKYDEAKGYLNNAMKLSQDDELKDRAEEYLAVIAEKGIKKKWLVNISLGGQYDTNVILSADDAALPSGISGKADWRAVVELDWRYRLLSGAKADASIGYNFYQSIHAKFYDFNVSYNLLDLTAQYAVKPYLSLSGLYSFEYVLASGNGYSYANTVMPSIIIIEGKGISTTLKYRYRHKHFMDTRIYTTNSERTGSNHLFGITQEVLILPAIQTWFGYAYDKDITRKDYWDYDGHKGFIDFRFKLPYKLSLDLYGEYNYRQYHGISPDFNKERKDNIYTYSASITRPITDTFDITISQAYTDNGSNIAYYNYSRAITSLFITGRF